jgi:hypothetical protein
MSIGHVGVECIVLWVGRGKGGEGLREEESASFSNWTRHCSIGFWSFAATANLRYNDLGYNDIRGNNGSGFTISPL